MSGKEAVDRSSTDDNLNPPRHAGQQITHTDLRQVEQDVLIWGLNPSLGILVLCSQLPKAAGLNTLSFVRHTYLVVPAMIWPRILVFTSMMLRVLNPAAFGSYGAGILYS